MKSLEQQMSFYSSYHRDDRNKATHFIGVPTIVYAILVALGWLRIEVAGTSITAAMVITVVLLVYYFLLDAAMAAALVIVLGGLLLAADWTSRMPILPVGLAVFGICFVGGWIIQFVGHAYEGRKPALFDNLFQIFVAPIFLTAEAFFMLGLRKELRARVDAMAEALLEQSKNRAAGGAA